MKTYPINICRQHPEPLISEDIHCLDFLNDIEIAPV